MRTEQVVTECYVCENCGYKTTNLQAMTRHEKTHNQETCQHENVNYNLENGEDYCSPAIGFHCSDCLLEVTASLKQYDQEFLKQLFEMAGGKEELAQTQAKIRKKKEAKVNMEKDFETKWGRKMTEIERAVFLQE